MLRLAIVCTHPIQYYAPVFAELAKRPELKVRVFYGWRGPGEKSLDPGFGQRITWDIPLLDGYEYEFVTNVAKDPGSHHYDGINLPDLIQRIEAWGAQAVLIYGWSYQSHWQAMRHFKGRIPVLFRGDSTLLAEKPGLRQLARRFYLRWVYRHVDVALYVGENNRRYFQAHGLRHDQMQFAPHAIDNNRFEQHCHSVNGTGSDSHSIRQSLAIRDDQVVFLFVGKFEPVKAPQLLMTAFKTIDPDKAHLIMIGSGELQSELEQAGSLNIHLVGFKNQTELPDWYRAADLVVLASRSETWGLALNEAMACGRAVIASDRVGAAIDLIEVGGNGWICKADDSNDLANCLQTAVSMGRPGLLEMGARSKQIIQPWSIDRQTDAIASAVVNVVGIGR